MLEKIREEYFPPQPGPGVGDFTTEKVLELIRPVIERKILSGYRGNSSLAFFGGEEVRAFEKEVAAYLATRGDEDLDWSDITAVACNSATSGLWMACAAIGLQPGDEVIVPPWSMSCSATIPLLFGAIPVFVDIEPEYFCMDPVKIEAAITDKTKAIIAVDMFGHTIDPNIAWIAKAHGLYLIEDAAQAIGGYRCGIPAGLVGDVGVFSFTQGKHLTAGEGGCCVTQNADLALRLQLLRNHGEAVLGDMERTGAWFEGAGAFIDNECGIVGMNLRMTEIQAAVLREELRRLPQYLKQRRQNAINIRSFFGPDKISEAPGCYNSLYVLPFAFPEDVDTDKLAVLVRGQLMPDSVRLDRGVPVSNGYVVPLYLLPIFREKEHWAFKNTDREYRRGLCPVAERLNNQGLIITLLHGLDIGYEECAQIGQAFSNALKYLQEGGV